MRQPKIVIHNHYSRPARDSAVQVISRGPLEDGIGLVDVTVAGKKVGSGFWDTHAGAYWITPNGGSEKTFKTKSDIERFFAA
jgi:hypothetical protein